MKRRLNLDGITSLIVRAEEPCDRDEHRRDAVSVNQVQWNKTTKNIMLPEDFEGREIQT